MRRIISLSIEFIICNAMFILVPKTVVPILRAILVLRDICIEKNEQIVYNMREMNCFVLRANNFKAHIFLTHEGEKKCIAEKYNVGYLLSSRRVPPLYLTIIAF